MTEKFKQTVLYFRYGFEKLEKLGYGMKSRGTQKERREEYESYLNEQGASIEIIEFSMNEFIPLTKKELK